MLEERLESRHLACDGGGGVLALTQVQHEVGDERGCRLLPLAHSPLRQEVAQLTQVRTVRAQGVGAGFPAGRERGDKLVYSFVHSALHSPRFYERAAQEVRAGHVDVSPGPRDLVWRLNNMMTCDIIPMACRRHNPSMTPSPRYTHWLTD